MSPADFDRTVTAVRDFVNRKAPAITGIEATKHFKKSFRDEGFTDDVLKKWKDITPRRKAQKRNNHNGKLTGILTDTGELGDSLTWSQENDQVVVSSDLKYAERHNEGTKGMPKRQFMGPSKKLDQTIMAKFDREIDKIFN